MKKWVIHNSEVGTAGFFVLNINNTIVTVFDKIFETYWLCKEVLLKSWKSFFKKPEKYIPKFNIMKFKNW